MRDGEGTKFTIDRKIFSSDIWQSSPWKLKIWIYLIGQANHTPKEYAGIIIKRGEIVRSYRTIAENCGYKIGYRLKKPSLHTIYNVISELKNEGRIKIRMLTYEEMTKKLRRNDESNTRREWGISLITINNYNHLQPFQNYEGNTRKGKQGNSKGTAREHNNNVLKNEVRIKEDNIVANQNHLRLVSLLKTLILQNDPKAKIPDDITKWIDPIDKLERIDGRTLIEIEGVIRFSQDNDFWKSNILSTRNLRKHFPQLILQAKKGGFIVTPRPEPKPENPEEKSKREKREKEEKEAQYQEGLKKWRGMSLEELRKHQVNLRKWGKIAKIPPVEVERDLAEIIKEKEKNEQ